LFNAVKLIILSY